MKVVHYIASIDINGGGTTEYMRLLSKSIKNDIELSIATGISKNPIDINGVPIKFFNTAIIRWFSLLNEFRNFLINEKPDIVHINGIWTPQNWAFQKVAQQLNIKVVLSPHGMLELWILQHNPFKKKLALLLFQYNAIKKTDHIHATSQMEKQSIEDLKFNNTITIIPNGIDLTDVTKFKESYGSKKMIFISRIHPKKGIELLLEAWRNCDTQGWTLEIAGSGKSSYTSKLLQSATELNKVHFVGSIFGEAKWNFLRSADVLVLPSYSENFAIVVAEALAVGVPVITTTGTPWEDLENYNCGWWINMSQNDLELTLLKVLNEPNDVLEIMGNNGKKLVKDKYDIKEVGNNMIKMYENILAV